MPKGVYVRQFHERPICHPKRRVRGNGLCDECYRIQYRKNNPGKCNEAVAASVQKTKREVLTYYGPQHRLRCSWKRCMVTDLDMLSLDHINNDGAKHRKANGWASGGYKTWLWVKRHNYPEGFQTLCMNHQQKKKVQKAFSDRKARYNGKL